jgi:hypothetical protein
MCCGGACGQLIEFYKRGEVSFKDVVTFKCVAVLCIHRVFFQSFASMLASD